MFTSWRKHFQPRRNRWLLRFCIVAAVGLGMLVWALWQRSNYLTVENRSGQPIKRLRITVAGETSTFKNVPTESDVTAPVANKGDLFVLEGELRDGTTLRARGVAGEGVRLIVIPGGTIEVQQAKQPK